MKFLLKDLAMDKTRLYMTRPDSSQHTNMAAAITEDLHLIVGFEWFFFLALSMASLFSSAITVSASAVTYAEANLSFSGLVSTSVKSYPRLLITWFYVSLFDLGYLFLAFLSIFPFASPFRPTTFLHRVILCLVIAFHMHLAVVWIMSTVISVLEEKKSGLEAIGKASQILKGFKSQGFLLNLMHGVPNWIVFIFWFMEIKRKGAYTSLFWDLIFLNVTCMIKMSLMVVYTVFYHYCKQSHGEDVELQGSFEYIKVSSEPMITT